MYWEYEVIQIGTVMSGRCKEILNHLGALGWELVAIDDGYAYLKRAKA